MLGLRGIPAEKLTALRFRDDETFRRAARIAVEGRIPVDAVGHKTLVVHIEHVMLFEHANLKFDREIVADPEKVPSKEYAALRRQVFGLKK
jgi:hypothetical protein